MKNNAIKTWLTILLYTFELVGKLEIILKMILLTQTKSYLLSFCNVELFKSLFSILNG